MAVGSLFILIGSGTDTKDGSTKAGEGSSSHPAMDDVVVSQCNADSLGQLSMSLTVTNNSSKPSDYFINVAWETSDGSTQLDTSFGSVNHLAAGQKTTVEGLSFKQASGAFTCKVVDVTRTAST